MDSQVRTTHIHHERYAVDCDGPISDGYIVSYDCPPEDEWYLALGFSLGDESRVFMRTDEDGLRTAEINTPTEEGFRNITLQECQDDCDRDAYTHRDYRAEEEGY